MNYTVLLHTDSGPMSVIPDFTTGNIDIKVGQVPALDDPKLANDLAKAVDAAYVEILDHMDAYDNDEGFFIDLPNGAELFIPRELLDLEEIKIHSVEAVSN